MNILAHDITIEVINRRTTTSGEYVGRPSPLGNPFQLAGHTRDDVIDAYVEWLAFKIRTKDSTVCGELERLRQKAIKNKKLVLACWCAPLRCHAQVIAETLAKAIVAGTTFVLPQSRRHATCR